MLDCLSQSICQHTKMRQIFNGVTRSAAQLLVVQVLRKTPLLNLRSLQLDHCWENSLRASNPLPLPRGLLAPPTFHFRGNWGYDVQHQRVTSWWREHNYVGNKSFDAIELSLSVDKLKCANYSILIPESTIASFATNPVACPQEVGFQYNYVQLSMSNWLQNIDWRPWNIYIFWRKKRPLDICSMIKDQLVVEGIQEGATRKPSSMRGKDPHKD